MCFSGKFYWNLCAKVEIISNFKIIFSRFNNEFDTSFKFYFINLYQIIKYIDKNSINEKEAKEYTNIVRAQLSKDELILLFYNSIGVIDFSGENYKLLVEKYSFFEHLRYNDLVDSNNIDKVSDILISKYRINAFGKNDDLKKKWIELTNKDNKA